MKNKFLLPFLFLVLLSSCTRKTWVISSATSTAIPIDQSLDKNADSTYVAYLAPIKTQIDAKMNTVIGVAAQTMRAQAPESLLSNWTADITRKAGSDYLKKNVDISIVNLGGLRTVIPEGNITVGKIFELMPFENELVILWIKGDKVYDLCQQFAKVGGEGVSGLRFTISQGEAKDITINGKPIEMGKTYSIATNDYLAGGNDKMVQLAMYDKRENTGIKLREMFLNFIIQETKKGHRIESQLDGRIK